MDPSIEEAFHKDFYSTHFNILTVLGQWGLETDNRQKRYLYLLYKFVVGVVGFFIAFSALIDLYHVSSDFRKVVYNMCTTSLLLGIWIKNLYLQTHSGRLNKLRLNLFLDGWTQRNDPQNVQVREKFSKILLKHRKAFYYIVIIILPLWISTALMSLIWPPRHLPFSVWTPFDLEDNLQFTCGFLYHAFGSIYITLETIHADLAMFSILLQITCEYKILSINIQKLDDVLSEKTFNGSLYKKDINSMLVNHQIKTKLRRIVHKQLMLMRYVEELESAYCIPMLIQLICGFLLSIGNGLELIVVSMNFSLKLSYQIGYTIIVLGDVFMCCNLADLLIDHGRGVVWSLYDIAWYDMDSEVRRLLVLITIGAQKIQTLTAAKMFSLNLTTFLGLLKNVYSWLALFRQLVIKK